MSVKDITAYPSSVEWSEDCEAVVREYFENPDKIIMTVCLHGGVITARLALPNNNVDIITYFLRTPWQIYNQENFLATVHFGTFGKNLPNSILHFMTNIYTPAAFSTDNWPKSILFEITEWIIVDFFYGNDKLKTCIL